MQRISHILDMYEKHGVGQTVKIQNKMIFVKVYVDGKYDGEKIGYADLKPQICMRFNISDPL